MTYCRQIYDLVCNPKSGNVKKEVKQLLEKLPGWEKASFCREVSWGGTNVLMAAVRYHPETVDALLGVIADLDKLNRAKIIKQATKDGWNALMLAARHHPEAIDSLCEAIADLDKLDRVKIIKQATSDGWNALMLAARHHPEAIDALLGAMADFDNPERAKVLKQAKYKGFNALTFAAAHHPEVINTLLEAISSLDKPDQADILKQTAHYWNTVMYAVYPQPEAVEALLAAIARLNEPDQVDIFSQIASNTNNVIVLARNYHPENTSKLLDALFNLKDKSILCSILLKTIINIRDKKESEFLLEAIYQRTSSDTVRRELPLESFKVLIPNLCSYINQRMVQQAKNKKGQDLSLMRKLLSSKSDQSAYSGTVKLNAARKVLSHFLLSTEVTLSAMEITALNEGKLKKSLFIDKNSPSPIAHLINDNTVSNKNIKNATINTQMFPFSNTNVQSALVKVPSSNKTETEDLMLFNESKYPLLDLSLPVKKNTQQQSKEDFNKTFKHCTKILKPGKKTIKDTAKLHPSLFNLDINKQIETRLYPNIGQSKMPSSSWEYGKSYPPPYNREWSKEMGIELDENLSVSEYLSFTNGR